MEMEDSMQIIDIHVHVYEKIAGITQGAPITGAGYGKAKIGNDFVQFTPPSFESTTSAVEVLIGYMDWCGVDKALLMPNPLYGYTNEYFIQSIKKYQDRLKGVALVDFLKGQKAADELVKIYDETPLFGFKIETDSTFQCGSGKNIADDEFAPIWDVCNQYHQPVFLHLFTDRDVQDFVKLVPKYSNINFILCHMGADSCFGKGKGNQNNFDFLLQFMKKQANVFMDTSTVPEYFLPEEYPYPSAIRRVEKAYKTVGAEKIMWASDYPGMLKTGTYRELINYVCKNCSIPEADMKLIMGENADRLFFQNAPK